MTGRGAGLSSDGLKRKIAAIRRGIALNQPDKHDPIDVVSKVGGLDIAGLMGVYLGGALYHIPVLLDGFISSVAALAAALLCPNAKDYMMASHASDEPAGTTVLDALELKPLLYAGMRLGEGTGAVAVMPLLDMALAVYQEGSSFDDISSTPMSTFPEGKLLFITGRLRQRQVRLCRTAGGGQRHRPAHLPGHHAGLRGGGPRPGGAPPGPPGGQGL